MKQVFNVQKMLVDIPLDMATQTVHVNGELFYVNKLLQQKSGHYFIPEQFFHIKDKNQGPNVGVLHEDDLLHWVMKSNTQSASIINPQNTCCHIDALTSDGFHGGSWDDLHASVNILPHIYWSLGQPAIFF